VVCPATVKLKLPAGLVLICTGLPAPFSGRIDCPYGVAWVALVPFRLIVSVAVQQPWKAAICRMLTGTVVSIRFHWRVRTSSPSSAEVRISSPFCRLPMSVVQPKRLLTSWRVSSSLPSGLTM
jgi:hypothetical protein